MLNPSGRSTLTLYLPGGMPEMLYLPSVSVLPSNCFGPANRSLASLTGGHGYSSPRRNPTSPKIVPPGGAFDRPLMYSRSAAASDNGRVRLQMPVASILLPSE